MSEAGGEEGGGDDQTYKRKLDSPESLEATRRIKRGRGALDLDKLGAIMSDVYDGIITNEFVGQGVKDSCRELKLIVDEIRKGEAEMRLTPEQIEERKGESIQKQLKSTTNTNEWQLLRNKHWPRNAYTHVRLSATTLKNILKEQMVVLMANKGDENFAELAERFPTISELDQDLLEQDGGLLLEREERILIQGVHGANPPAKKCRLLSTNPWEEVEPRIAEIIEKITNQLTKDDKSITVVIPEDWNLDIVRKELERALAKTNIDCRLKGNKAQMLILQGEAKKTNVRETTTTISIPMGGKSYAEALKDLKENVVPATVGVQIRSVTENNGSVKVIVKGREEANKLVKEINKKTDAGASIQRKDKGLFIFNIEEETTEEEIKFELAKNVGRAEIDAKITFRCNERGKSALVFVEERLAEVIINMKFIRRSGWTNWTIKEKTNPPFCVKCQFFGHTLRECKAMAAKSVRCMNCGECSGHFSKDCKKEPACPCCDKKGHRMNSTACPSFKLYIDIKRNGSVF